MSETEYSIYDYLDTAIYNRWRRRCPKCGDEDVKYAIHNKATLGCDCSVRCNNCRHEEIGDNNHEDLSRLIFNWHDTGE